MPEETKKKKTKLHNKLAVLQRKVSVPKNLYNDFGNYRYRSAEMILEVVKPLLDEQKCILTLSDDLIFNGDKAFVKANVLLIDLESDEEIVVSAYAAIANHTGMSADQETGCASSYARKYALNGLLLLDDNKDSDSNERQKEIRNKNAPVKENDPSKNGSKTSPKTDNDGWELS